jgi:hypothetical protein
VSTEITASYLLDGPYDGTFIDGNDPTRRFIEHQAGDEPTCRYERVPLDAPVPIHTVGTRTGHIYQFVVVVHA